MRLSLKRYSFLLFFQFAFLVADLFFNSFSYLFYKEKLHLMVFTFLVQDIFIIFEYLLFVYSVHSTCVYQVGASHVIIRNCKLFLATILTYFLLSACQHFWIVYNCLWSATPLVDWPMLLTLMSAMQRLVSFLYYYICKRTALCISDPRYYVGSIDWITQQMDVK